MDDQRFYFSKRRLFFVVAVAFAIGSAPLVFGTDGGYLYGSIMKIGGSPALGYVLFGASALVGFYHLPNLIRALLNEPAISVTADTIRLYQFPARTIPTPDVVSASDELGSLLLTLQGGRKKLINLKIVESSQECVQAIQSVIGARS